MSDRIRIIDPVTKEVMFDSDNIDPALLDVNRDEITGRRGPNGGWSISTMEQMERQIDQTRPSRFDCPTCEGDGVLFSLGEHIVCPTCKGVVK